MRPLLKTRWNQVRPPGSAVVLDREHPLAHGLRGYFPLPESGFTFNELVTGQECAYTLGRGGMTGGTLPTYTSTPYGQAPVFAANYNASNTTPGQERDYWFCGTEDRFRPAVLPISIFALVRLADVSIGQQFLFTTDTGTVSWTISGIDMLYAGPSVGLEVMYGDNTFSANRAKQSGALGLTNGVWYAFGCSVRGATDMSLYVNGVDVGGTYTGAGGTMVQFPGYPCGIGGVSKANTTSSQNIGNVFVLVAIWDRNLTDAEHMQMASDPFQVVTRQRLNSDVVTTSPTPSPTPNPNTANVFQAGEAFPGLSGKIGNQNADVWQAGETLWLLQPVATPTWLGVSSVSLGVNVTTTGTRKTFGVSTVAETVTVTTASTGTKFGSSTVGITDSITTAGTKKTFGISSVPIVVSVSTVGAGRVLGVSTTAITVTVTTVTRTQDHLFGVSTVPIVVSVTTSGHVALIMPPSQDGSFTLTPIADDSFTLTPANEDSFILIPIPEPI